MINYKIKKDRPQDELFGSYIDDKIIEVRNNDVIISKCQKNNKFKKLL